MCCECYRRVVCLSLSRSLVLAFSLVCLGILIRQHMSAYVSIRIFNKAFLVFEWLCSIKLELQTATSHTSSPNYFLYLWTHLQQAEIVILGILRNFRNFLRDQTHLPSLLSSCYVVFIATQKFPGRITLPKDSTKFSGSLLLCSRLSTTEQVSHSLRKRVWFLERPEMPLHTPLHQIISKKKTHAGLGAAIFNE
jgi:hypothetical protein